MNGAALVALRPAAVEVDVIFDDVPPDWTGIVPNVSIEAYHAMPGISKTGLDAINRSPAHYFAWHLDPTRPARPVRAGQLEGTLAHCALLEPDEFGKRYVTIPPNAPRRPTEAQWNAQKSNDNSIAAKAWWTEFGEQHAGKTHITVAQYETAMRQAQSMRRLSAVAEALRCGKPELTVTWIDPVTGAPCRCRPDWTNYLGGNQVALLDVKTCSNASAGEFCRQVARKRYHVQDALYCDGYAIAGKVDVMAFAFVAVESEWPYQAQVLQLDDQSRQQGRLEYQRNLAAYAACRARGQWPGYGDGVPVISLPQWAQMKELFRDADDLYY